MFHRLSPFAIFLAFAAFPTVRASDGPSVAIRSDFPGGNIVVLSNKPGDVQFRPDLRGGPDWFYWQFDATADRAGEVEFRLPNAPKLGVRGPALSRDGGRSWAWLGADRVTFAPPAAKLTDKVDRFTVAFGKPGETVRLAVAVPYLQTDLDAFLTAHRANPHLRRDVLTHTRTGKRPVALLRVGEPGKARSAVLVTARHHCCESMASYVLEGFLAEAMSDSPAGKLFRERYVLYAVPMVDVDGVATGDQGKNRPPHDHNRDYGPDAIYPEVRAIMDLADREDIRYSLDLHCPFIRGDVHEAFHFLGLGVSQVKANLNEWIGWIKEERPQAVMAPLNLLADPAKPNAANPRMNSHWFALRPRAVFAATLEVPYAQRGGAYDADLMRAYGAGLLRAWVRTPFTPTGIDGGHDTAARLREVRAAFARSYRGRPKETEQATAAVATDRNAAPHLRVEAQFQLATLRLQGKRFQEARELATAVAVDPAATATQREAAALLAVQAVCLDTESTGKDVDAAVSSAKGMPYPSAVFRASLFEAAADAHARLSDTARSLEYLNQLRSTVPGYDEGRVLNRIAAAQDRLGRPSEAAVTRGEAVRVLRARLDPMPKSVFGARMCGDLLEALISLPTATPAERCAAAELVLAHPVSSTARKEQARKVIAETRP